VVAVTVGELDVCPNVRMTAASDGALIPRVATRTATAVVFASKGLTFIIKSFFKKLRQSRYGVSVEPIQHLIDVAKTIFSLDRDYHRIFHI
jgi:hypothetical protein